ncbi:hypothetical protein PUNSTDRAFT_102696 [Punctularia strigosozonata HHB-11173 SS5]|uniref:uncharacterized protein n=1 Tax=Punctularia strigosozonata (strain HHB-11173) TaxID=741275 RepID=UPI0004416586|nr:uncharacterized protein PUNSTDRAFT_102696 [Punctularia strigosozonata HHB-11173 SS5]EIN09145.1 hypothetical protein PUNSTDRAFT_102696 [Punctularia strigosozonata HHB-11173 SS5]
MIVILAAASDILIAVSLCTILYRTKRSSLRNTRALINRLMLFVLNTGILTSMCAIATLVTSMAHHPETDVRLGLYHIMGRLYINSLLATLNARDQIRHYAFEPNMSLMFPTGFSHNTTTVRSSVLGVS